MVRHEIPDTNEGIGTCYDHGATRDTGHKLRYWNLLRSWCDTRYGTQTKVLELATIMVRHEIPDTNEGIGTCYDHDATRDTGQKRRYWNLLRSWCDMRYRTQTKVLELATILVRHEIPDTNEGIGTCYDHGATRDTGHKRRYWNLLRSWCDTRYRTQTKVLKLATIMVRHEIPDTNEGIETCYDHDATRDTGHKRRYWNLLRSWSDTRYRTQTKALELATIMVRHEIPYTNEGIETCYDHDATRDTGHKRRHWNLPRSWCDTRYRTQTKVLKLATIMVRHEIPDTNEGIGTCYDHGATRDTVHKRRYWNLLRSWCDTRYRAQTKVLKLATIMVRHEIPDTNESIGTRYDHGATRDTGHKRRYWNLLRSWCDTRYRTQTKVLKLATIMVRHEIPDTNEGIGTCYDHDATRDTGHKLRYWNLLRSWCDTRYRTQTKVLELATIMVRHEIPDTN